MRIGKKELDGVIVEKAGLSEEDGQRMVQLLDLIDGFNQLNNVEEVIAKIAVSSKTLMNAEATSVMFIDEGENALTIKHATGPVEDEILGRQIPIDTGFCGWVAENKSPIYANDIDEAGEESLFGGELSSRFTTENLICAPLLNNEQGLIGVIEAINCSNPSRLTANEIPLFQVFANHAATAIERVQNWQQQHKEQLEKDTSLREVHHRVKNDLALISGIVEIESLEIENKKAKKVFQKIQSRIKSMALVYEMLSGKEAHMNMEAGPFINKLVESIADSLKNQNQHIQTAVQADPVTIDPYQTLSCGLIINELMINSYKHAFKDTKEGALEVTLSENNGHIFIAYKDNGPGLAENFDMEEQNSIGFEMILALVGQLNGTIELKPGKGAHFEIRFETDSGNGMSSLKKALG
jgi:two-component sensor histidine kinase